MHMIDQDNKPGVFKCAQRENHLLSSVHLTLTTNPFINSGYIKQRFVNPFTVEGINKDWNDRTHGESQWGCVTLV